MVALPPAAEMATFSGSEGGLMLGSVLKGRPVPEFQRVATSPPVRTRFQIAKSSIEPFHWRPSASGFSPMNRRLVVALSTGFVALIGLGLKVTTLTMQSGQVTTLSQKFGRRFGLNERDGLGWRSTLRLVRGMAKARHQKQDKEGDRAFQALPNPFRKP